MKICRSRKTDRKIRQDLWQRVQNGEGQAVTEILILKAVLFIEDHLVDSEVKAEQIADAVGMSRSYFSVCFKKCTGYSVNSYIRKERIALACRLLREIRRFRQNRWRMLSGIMMKNIL